MDSKAREMLSEHGGDRRSDQRATLPVETWSTYCRDIGIAKRTANRWRRGAMRRRLMGRGKAQKQKTIDLYCRDIRASAADELPQPELVKEACRTGDEVRAVEFIAQAKAWELWLDCWSDELVRTRSRG